MKRIASYWLLWLLLICCCDVNAQIFQHIGVEDGLSNRRVAAIQKCNRGFMWFLTESGIDRFDGKLFKHYVLSVNEREESSFINLNWLFTDDKGGLWEVSKQGRIFNYNIEKDRFMLMYQMEERKNSKYPTPITYGYMNRDNEIWLCGDERIYRYHCFTGDTLTITTDFVENITAIGQLDSTRYFIGTNEGIRLAKLKGNRLTELPNSREKDVNFQINDIYYHEHSNKVFLGSFQQGVYVYDLALHENRLIDTGLSDISINCIRYYNEEEVLIATDGAGVYKMNVNTLKAEPYIVTDYENQNALNGNNIYDVYVDEENRIWLANYPFGITMRDGEHESYKWITHRSDHKKSLVNNQVNAIIEDHEGDLWFATNNGVSLYKEKTNSWHTFLSSFNKEPTNKNHTFISLCEVKPGIICVGGYNSGIYRIEKESQQIDYIVPATLSKKNTLADKYIRTILTEGDGIVWLGGYYNLKEVNTNTNSIRYIPNINGIFDLVEKDKEHLWVATADGLYLLHKASGEHRHIKLPTHSQHIYALHQSSDGLLYIGVNNGGLLIYNLEEESFKHYHIENCALISNNIYNIVSDNEERIILGMENGLASFNIRTHAIVNWTKEQGLRSEHFNPNSGILRRNGNFIFGSTDGAIEFHKSLRLKREHDFKMVLSDLKILDRIVYPNEEDSPLKTTINDTKEIRLEANQNIFSINISTINFSYPSLALYTWRLKGLHNDWSIPKRIENIRIAGVKPGKYTLEIMAISNEERNRILSERSIDIIIEEFFWLTPWAMLIYLIMLILIGIIGSYVYIVHKRRILNQEKIKFFINTAHDLRTPLTLIKVPLEKMAENEPLSNKTQEDIFTVLRNVNALLRLTTNLINVEKATDSNGDLLIAPYELNSYIQETVDAFRSYIQIKQLEVNVHLYHKEVEAWIDREKMESILKNLLSNAMKYTPAMGKVDVSVDVNKNRWYLQIKDTGIGIPKNEQKQLFKTHFRASNAINAKITGSGMGLMLVQKLTAQHLGKIDLDSETNQGTTVTLSFPLNREDYPKAKTTSRIEMSDRITDSHTSIPTNVPPANSEVIDNQNDEEKRYKLLIVEDNDELRMYLAKTLNKYMIQTCRNGKEAMEMVKEYFPDLIVSDIMMPELRGDEMCEMLKNDIETSHIPIILLTALEDEHEIVEGYKHGADEYITKPFSMNILQAAIESLLANRERLRETLSKLKFEELDDKEAGDEVLKCTNALDWKFIGEVRKEIINNLKNPDYSVDRLSSQLGMSRTRFYLKLRALTGMAPADYIRHLRLHQAAKLLLEDKLSIGDIAEITGFNDAKYFREVFKKHYHTTPSEYKKEKRGNQKS